jgi:site-specific DNA-methyltransferase (adenine-specific)
MIKLINGECLAEMDKLIQEEIKVDLILTDIPQEITQNTWDNIIPFDKLWEQYKRIIKDKGVIVLFGSEPFSSLLRTSNLNMYKYDWKRE